MSCTELSVIIFHAFPEKIPGGFIGVDIFFVISGFLISTITFSSVERDRFSLIEFYVRRVRRIFPALILVLVATLTFGWFVLFSDEYKQLGQHAAASAGFIQNFILWRESGYFDNASETKPLMHLWSLAVEEQFYIFWPLFLAFVWKRQWSFLKATVAIAIISFTANLYLMHRNPSAAFFLPMSRFWELMIGGMLAYIVLHRSQIIEKHKNGQSILGFLIIAVGLTLLNKVRDFPGWWALLPTLGAFLIISAGPDAYLNKKILSNKLMVWVGLISYPLYLWHWVLLSYLRILHGASTNTERLAALLSAFLLAWLTYKFIEKPFRSRVNSRVKAIYLLITLFIPFVFGFFCYKLNGFDDSVRLGKDKAEYMSYFENSIPEWKFSTKANIFKNYRDDCNFYDLDKYRIHQSTLMPRSSINKSCYTRDKNKPHSVLIWGDSHAQQLYFGLNANLPKDWQILLGVSSGCPANPKINIPSNTNYCDQSNWMTLQTITQSKPDVVIVGQTGGHSIKNMEQIIVKLHQLGIKKIIFTGPVPHWKPDLPKNIVRSLWDDTPPRTWIGVDQEYIDLNRKIKAEFKQQDNILYIDLLCTRQKRNHLIL